jgi:hypothetical protein
MSLIVSFVFIFIFRCVRPCVTLIGHGATFLWKPRFECIQGVSEVADSEDVYFLCCSGLLPAVRFGYSPFPGLGRSLSIGVEHARALKEQKTVAAIRLVAKKKGASSKSSRSVIPSSGAEEPTSKRYMSLRDELFQVSQHGHACVLALICGSGEARLMD